MKVSIGYKANFKIVFAGSFGVGKSTAIRTISDIEVVNTDVKSLELTRLLDNTGKTTTTVGFDYGELYMPDSTVVALYGLPGQERFDDMWGNILTADSGVILWLYGNSTESLNECKKWLEILKAHQAIRYLTVVVTRLPIPTPSIVLQPYRDLVRQYNPYAPVMSADPRNKNQVIQAVLMAIGTPAFDP